MQDTQVKMEIVVFRCFSLRFSGYESFGHFLGLPGLSVDLPLRAIAEDPTEEDNGSFRNRRRRRRLPRTNNGKIWPTDEGFSPNTAVGEDFFCLSPNDGSRIRRAELSKLV